MLLEARNLTKRFGGLTAVSKVDLAVGRVEVRGIIGPNGSGKSTLFNLISGVYRPEPGAAPEMMQTLTGTATAVGRTLIALIENGQQADGSVVLPTALVAAGAPAAIPA